MNKILLIIFTVISVFNLTTCVSLFYLEPLKQNSLYNPKKAYIAGRIEITGDDEAAEAAKKHLIINLLEENAKSDVGEFIWLDSTDYFLLSIDTKCYYLIGFEIPFMGTSFGNKKTVSNQIRFSIWPKINMKPEKIIYYIGDIYFKVAENSLGIIEPRIFIKNEIENARAKLNSYLMDSSNSYLSIKENILTPDSIPCQIYSVTKTRM